MGVKFAREYEHIVKDLTAAIANIDDSYTFFEMSAQDWAELDHNEQMACMETLADDIFFALGQSAKIQVGSGMLNYNAQRHIITVSDNNNQVTIVKLI